MVNFFEKFIDGFLFEFEILAHRFLFKTENAYNFFWMISFVLITLVLFKFNRKRIKQALEFIRSPQFAAELKKDLFSWSLRFLYKPILFSYFLINFDEIESYLFSLSNKYGIGFAEPLIHLDPILGSVVVGVLIYTTTDFFDFLNHYLQHKIKWYWYFHMNHHFATVLTPLTKYRLHLVDYFGTLLFPVLLKVPATLFIYKIFLIHGEDTSLSVIVAFGYIFHLPIVHLRHSHVKLHYGPYLSKIFISPVMHQLHHSRERKHLDKNWGLHLSIWDGIFNSRYIPDKKDENFNFGIRGYEKLIQKRSYWYEMYLPFILIARDIRRFLRNISKNKVAKNFNKKTVAT